MVSRNLKVEAFGKVRKDGSLAPPYDRIYALGHIVMVVLGKFKRVRENDIVFCILGFEIFIAICVYIWFVF